MIEQHIAFIMDGNRRYAKKNAISKKEAYKKGMEKFLEILSYQVKYKLKETSFFALSSDNYRERGEEDLGPIFQLIQLFSKSKEIEEFIKSNSIKIELCGDISQLEKDEKKNKGGKTRIIQELRKKLEKWNSSSEEKLFKANIFINYDGQEEILKASKELARKVEERELKASQIKSKDIEEALYYKGEAPNIIVRPGDAPRISGFFLWHSKYSEIYFTKKLWPELDEADFVQILNWYKSIKRNFGA